METNEYEDDKIIGNQSETQIKKHYDRLVLNKIEGYSLVSISLKNFLDISHQLGHDESEIVIQECFEAFAKCLSQDEYITRISGFYFNLLIRCKDNEEDLHPWAHKLHNATKNILMNKTGNMLYIEMGFYPMIKADIDYYDARYFADLCRLQSSHKMFAETVYEMYYVSYVSDREEYAKYQDQVRSALDHGDFKLYLQPKVDLKTGKVTMAEALLRWIDPKEGMLPIDSFLPSLEANGSIREVDRAMFDKACSYLERWHKNFHKDIKISFNLSQAYYNGPYFMPEYKETFEKYNFPKKFVQIELLESIVLNDLEKLLPLVNEIYDYGFSCALDDFGSGFSSLDILINARISTLKLDRSLFKNIENEKEKKVIKRIIELAHDIDMNVIAEGIETEAYAAYLKEIGCDAIQGYYYYRPMPIEEFEDRFILNQERNSN